MRTLDNAGVEINELDRAPFLVGVHTENPTISEAEALRISTCVSKIQSMVLYGVLRAPYLVLYPYCSSTSYLLLLGRSS